MFNEKKLVTLTHDKRLSPQLILKNLRLATENHSLLIYLRESLFYIKRMKRKWALNAPSSLWEKENLKIIPAKICVLEYIQEKAVLYGVTDNQKLVVATLPPPTLKAPWAVLI